MSPARPTRLVRLVHGLVAGPLLAGLEALCWQWPLLHGTTMRVDPAAPILAAGLYALAGGLGSLGGRTGILVGLSVASAGGCMATGDPHDAALRCLAAAGATLIAAVLLRFTKVLIAAGVLGLSVPLWIPDDPALPGTPERPDVILVVLDTVAADRTSLHGAPTDNTPNLQALADRGLDFREAVATSPWTIPSHATLFTGALPRETGCHFERPLLDDRLPTTAELLAAQGYRTGLFAANPWLEPSTGLARGFEAVHSQSIYAASFWAYGVFRWVPESPFKGGPIVVREALHWLERAGDAPSLAVVNLMEAHAPYHLVEEPGRFGVGDPVTASERAFDAQTQGWWATAFPADEQEQTDAARVYAAAIAAVDAQLADLVQGLEASGRRDRTWLIVTSDHGEAFGEHGVQGHLVGLWRELVHVPLVIVGPGLSPARIPDVVSLQAIHPTVLALAGLTPEAPALVPWPPEAATAAGLGWPATGPGVALSEQYRPELMWAPGLWGAEAEGNRWDQYAVRARLHGQSLIVEAPADGGPERRHTELLPGDRGDTTDPRLDALIDQVRGRPDAAQGREDPALEAGLRERLQALGYMDHGG